MSFSIPWGTIKSLLYFLGPLLFPKLIGFYRRTRATSAQGGAAAGLDVSPPPPSVSRAIQLLLGTGILFLVASLGGGGSTRPENLFIETQSRLQIPTETLFNRVAATLRPDGKLSATDEALRAKFVNMESRHLYATYGPDVVANCLFCTTEDPNSFLFYALPELLAPHLVNLVVIGVATSSILASMWAAEKGMGIQQQAHPAAAAAGGPRKPNNSNNNLSVRATKAVPRWRYTATLASVVLMAADAYVVWSTDPLSVNKAAKRLSDVTWLFWGMRTARFACLGFLDLALAALAFLSGTNRAFLVGRPGPAERVADATRALAAAKSKLSAAGIVKNTADRDAGLRAKGEAYWSREVALMGEVMQERDVLDGINDAVAGRLNLRTIERDAETYADSVFRPLLAQQAVVLGKQQRQQNHTLTQRVPPPAQTVDGAVRGDEGGGG